MDSTPMPAREPLPIDIQQFVQCNAIRLRHESFDSGIKRLVKVLQGYMTEPPLRTFRNHALTMNVIIVTSLVLWFCAS